MRVGIQHAQKKGGLAVILWDLDNKNPVTGVWASGSHLAG